MLSALHACSGVLGAHAGLNGAALPDSAESFWLAPQVLELPTLPHEPWHISLSQLALRHLPGSLEGVPGSSGFWFGTIKRGAPPARPRTSQRSSSARKLDSKIAAAGTLVKEGGCRQRGVLVSYLPSTPESWIHSAPPGMSEPSTNCCLCNEGDARELPGKAHEKPGQRGGPSLCRDSCHADKCCQHRLSCPL